ncbi:hypothetical protein ZIOFF_045603 [Zingiber officinale]|uniref:Uncharacterized protein n=1 Tax=Zingiber officinale TaxID=94328 RepID=A0A8J5G441_ZINOF|nr:hypothetical protein ZIOFF_045603 [Zingiber officinale]
MADYYGFRADLTVKVDKVGGKEEKGTGDDGGEARGVDALSDLLGGVAGSESARSFDAGGFPPVPHSFSFSKAAQERDEIEDKRNPMKEEERGDAICSGLCLACSVMEFVKGRYRVPLSPDLLSYHRPRSPHLPLIPPFLSFPLQSRLHPGPVLLLSDIKTYDLLDEQVHDPSDAKLVEEWRNAMDAWTEHVISLASSKMVGNYIHNMTIFFGGLIIGLINCWQIALLTLATSPFIVAVGGISNIFLHRRFHILEHCMPLQMILLLSILMQPHFKLHYGRSATSDQIEEAVKIAHAHDFITSLEMGYEAQVTSGLDFESEKVVQEAQDILIYMTFTLDSVKSLQYQMDCKKFLQFIKEKKKRILDQKETPLKWKQKLKAAAKAKADVEVRETKLKASTKHKRISYSESDSGNEDNMYNIV